MKKTPKSILCIQKSTDQCQITLLEGLEQRAYDLGIIVEYCSWAVLKSQYLCPKDETLPPLILLPKHVSEMDKVMLLAEEIAHHHLTVGDISAEDTVDKRKQEQLARRASYMEILPPEKIKEAVTLGCKTIYDIACFINFSTDYVQRVIESHRQSNLLPWV